MLLKSCFILTLVYVFSTTQICAQKKFYFGLNTGMNVSLFNQGIGEFGANPSSDYEDFIRISGLLGVNGQYYLAQGLFVRVGIDYNLKGGSYRRENNSVVILGGNGNEQAYFYKNYRLNYFEVPVSLGLNFTTLFQDRDYYDVQYLLSVGLVPGFNTSSSLRSNDFVTTGGSRGLLADVDSKFSVDAFDYAQSSIFSFLVDFGVQFENNDGQSMAVSLRMYRTMDNVYAVEELEGDNMITRMTTFSLMYTLLF